MAAPVTEAALLERLQAVFGYPAFRPPQLSVIQSVLARRDALVIMPTGGGKSMCYALPAVMQAGVAIIVCPLIALMQDQVQGLRRKGVIASALFHSMKEESRNLIYADLYAAAPTIKLLFITPEGLEASKLRHALQQLHSRNLLSLVAVDEAHCISSWGHTFRASYRRLGVLREDLPGVPILALTASATTRVKDDICVQLRIDPACVYLSSFDRANLSYQCMHKDAMHSIADDMAECIRDTCGAGPPSGAAAGSIDAVLAAAMDGGAPAAQVASDSASAGRRSPASVGGKGKGKKKKQVTPSRTLDTFFKPSRAASPASALSGSDADGSDPPMIGAPAAAPVTAAPARGSAVIYAHMRTEADTLAADLTMRGVSAASYHGGMTPADRTDIQRRWTEGRITAVVATEAFGMGIDKANVRFVGHYTLPKSMEGLYQECGRAGRDGAPAVCRIYYSREDLRRLRSVTESSIEKKHLAAEAAHAGVKRNAAGFSATSHAPGDATHAGSAASSSAAGGGVHKEVLFDPMEALQAVMNFCEQPTCRRMTILKHFGEKPSFVACDPGRGHQLCDYCADPAGFKAMLARVYGIHTDGGPGSRSVTTTAGSSARQKNGLVITNGRVTVGSGPRLGSFVRGSDLVATLSGPGTTDVAAERSAAENGHDALMGSLARPPGVRLAAGRPRRAVEAMEPDVVHAAEYEDSDAENRTGVAGVMRHPMSTAHASMAAAARAMPTAARSAPSTDVRGAWKPPRLVQAPPAAISSASSSARVTAAHSGSTASPSPSGSTRLFQSARTILSSAAGGVAAHHAKESLSQSQSSSHSGRSAGGTQSIRAATMHPSVQEVIAHFEAVEEDMQRLEAEEAAVARSRAGRGLGSLVQRVKDDVATFRSTRGVSHSHEQEDFA